MKTWDTPELIVENIINNMLDAFAKQPPYDIMKTNEATKYFFNALLNLLRRTCFALKISQEELIENINKMWSVKSKSTTN